MDEVQVIETSFWSVYNWQLWVGGAILYYFCAGLFFRWSGWAAEIKADPAYGSNQVDRESALAGLILVSPVVLVIVTIASVALVAMFVVTAGAVDPFGIGNGITTLIKTLKPRDKEIG